MPLHTQIIRDGEPLHIEWREATVAAMAIAASLDGPSKGVFDKKYTADNPPPFAYPEEKNDGPLAGKDQTTYPDTPMPIDPQASFQIAMYPALAVTPLNEGEFTVTHHHKFVDTMDGYEIEFLPGDVLRAFRN